MAWRQTFPAGMVPDLPSSGGGRGLGGFLEGMPGSPPCSAVLGFSLPRGTTCGWT